MRLLDIKKTLPAVPVAIGAVLSILCAKFVSFVPHAFIALVWMFCFLAMFRMGKTDVQRSVWFNFAFVCLLFAGVEAYFYYNSVQWDVHVESDNAATFFTPDDILGYAPRKNSVVREKKYFKNRLLYDVVYTIDERGLRITPDAAGADDACVIVFGGSFTFGSGVNDDESMPYVLGQLQKAKVYNLGYQGYGPHQMLAAIENDLIPCQPKLAIYQALDIHAARSAGYSGWDIHGPKYVLDGGRVVYKGHFDDPVRKYNRVVQDVVRFLARSYLYQKVFKNVSRVSEKDIDLFLAIVKESGKLLQQKFPGVEFHVLYWDAIDEDATSKAISEGMKKIGFEVHAVSDILPGRIDLPIYRLGECDQHPSALAHRLLAEYVANTIMSRKSLQAVFAP